MIKNYICAQKFKQFIKRNNPDNLFPIQEEDKKEKEKEKDNNLYETLEDKIKHCFVRLS